MIFCKHYRRGYGLFEVEGNRRFPPNPLPFTLYFFLKLPFAYLQLPYLF